MAPDLHSVTLQTLAYGGEALGHLEDGRAVFVPFGLPGERVVVRLTEERRAFARATLVRLETRSEDRIEARCKHFGVCGGCHYQNLPYDKQLEAKARILGDQLARLGGIKEPPVEPCVPSPNPWNYRNQIQLHLTQSGRLGYVRAPATTTEGPTVFAIEECHLPQPAINELWPRLELDGRPGIERVTIRVGTDEDLMITLEGDSAEMPEVEIGSGISVTHTFEGDCIVIAGRDHVTLQALGRDFRASAPSFFQANTAVAEKMVGHVLERAPSSGGTALDVYCGVGLFSAFLAPKYRRLVAVESSASACEDFEVNLDEFDNVELYEAAAEQTLPSLDVKADMAVVDPPRGGLERGALEALLRMKPGRLVYVSCDPPTLGRDAKQLIGGGYRLTEITPFDMFPQTYHIESISVFEQ